jgi:iron complex transport system ATP-binding protein
MESPNTSTLLSVRDLTAGYHTQKVIDGISFEVAEKNFLGIIGPNGSGKTTLFRLVAHFLKPWGGDIFYRGQDMDQWPPSQLAREIAVMPQGMENIFSFSVEELVAMGRFPHLGRMGKFRKRDREQVDRSMELTGILGFRKKKLAELSGGERQRVFLAQTLAQEPNLLLLDEPIAHLDIGHQIKILDVIKRLNREQGTTVIIVFHDLNLASMYCDRLILLKEGRIFREGTPAEIMTYEIIEEVYGTVVLVHENPVTKKPHVLLISMEAKE